MGGHDTNRVLCSHKVPVFPLRRTLINRPKFWREDDLAATVRKLFSTYVCLLRFKIFVNDLFSLRQKWLKQNVKSNIYQRPNEQMFSRFGVQSRDDGIESKGEQGIVKIVCYSAYQVKSTIF